MPHRKHIAKILSLSTFLLVGTAWAGQFNLPGDVLNIDTGKGPASAEISFEFYRLTNGMDQPENSGPCNDAHEATPQVFHVKTDESGNFTLPNVPSGD